MTGLLGPDDGLADGRYECPVCQTRHESIGDKKRHMREDHPGVKKGAA